MRKTIVVLAAGTTVLFMTACGGNQETYDAVCVNPQNNIRIDEDFCEEDDDDFDPNIPHSWMFFPGGRAPVMGAVGSGGVLSAPGNARTNFLSTDSDSKSKTKPKPTIAPVPSVNLNKPTTQAPKPSTQAPKPQTQAPRTQAAPQRPSSGTRNSTSGGNRTSGSSTRSGR